MPCRQRACFGKAFGRPVPFYHFVGPNRAQSVPSTVRRFRMDVTMKESPAFGHREEAIRLMLTPRSISSLPSDLI